MPASSKDRRALTWKKLARQVSSKVENRPYNRTCCWYIRANNQNAGLAWSKGKVHSVKLSKTGTGNRFQTHRLMHVIVHVDDYLDLAVKVLPGQEIWHVAHRCGRGKGSMIVGTNPLCCINPFHSVKVDPKVNQDHKGCRYGTAASCPHNPGMNFKVYPTYK